MKREFYDGIRGILDSARAKVYQSANFAMVEAYWQIGKSIVEEQDGSERAEYGAGLLKELSRQMTQDFGKGFTVTNLKYMRQFYLAFPNGHALRGELSWTHYRALLRVDDENARLWYLNEAADEGWSTRTLDRNIGTQYYYRLLQSPKKEAVIAEMKEKTRHYPSSQFELIKSPIVAEFLGFRPEDSFLESDLESAILSHIRDFMMELGRGFAFVARQQHIITDTEDYYIDLVFYNIELKCYVLIDLKMGTITHQDVGQIDMYVRMYDDLKRKEGDNPTIGILLCGETSEDIARYSVLHDNDHLFMSKYLTYLPTKEQLRDEIERQKEIFYMQHPALEDADGKEGNLT